MTCSCKSLAIVVQMGVLVGAGAVLGYIDHKRRPVMVHAPEIAPLAPVEPAKQPAPAPIDVQKPPTPAKQPDNPAPATPEPKGNASTPTPAPVPPAPAGEQIDAELVKQGHITVEQGWALFNAVQPATFIDARRAEHYEAGHVKLAYRLALDAFKGQVPAHLKVMDRGETYVVYCEGGNCDESVAVQKQLVLSGYQKVYVMHAGYPGWVAAGHPIETGPDPIEVAEGRP